MRARSGVSQPASSSATGTAPASSPATRVSPSGILQGFLTLATRVRGTRIPSSSKATSSCLVAPIASRMAIGPTSVGISARSPEWARASNTRRLGGRTSRSGSAPASIRKCPITCAPTPISFDAETRECRRRSATTSPSRTSQGAIGQWSSTHSRRIRRYGANPSSVRLSRARPEYNVPKALAGSSSGPAADAAIRSRACRMSASPRRATSNPAA